MNKIYAEVMTATAKHAISKSNLHNFVRVHRICEVLQWTHACQHFQSISVILTSSIFTNCMRKTNENEQTEKKTCINEII